MSSVRPSASYCFCPGRRHRLCGRLGRCAGFLAFVILGARAALFPVYGVHTPCGWIDEARWRVPDLTKPPVADNGWHLYQQAALELEHVLRALPPPTDAATRESRPDAATGPWANVIDAVRVGSRPAADARPVLEAGAGAFALVRRAAGWPYVSPSLPGPEPPPGMRAFPVLARLEAARVRYLSSQGRSAEALSAARDAYAMAVNIPRHGSLEDFLVGNACIAIVHPPARDVLREARLGADDCLRHARALRALRTRKWPLGRAIQFEFRTSVVTAADLCSRGPEALPGHAHAWRVAGLGAAGTAPSPVRFLAWDPADSTEWLEDRMARLAHAARPPYGSRSWARLWERTQLDLTARGDWFARAVLAPLNEARETDLAARARLAIEETTAYLAAFRARYGHYPTALARLAPELTDALPDDPYTDEPFRYEPAADGYRLGSPKLDEYEAGRGAELDRP